MLSEFSSSSAGSRAIGLALTALVAILAPPSTASGAEPSPTSATIRIGLPEGGGAPISVAMDKGAVSVELPAGASIPFDVVGTSHGILRDSKLSSRGGGRTTLRLQIASGVLDRVDYETGAVTLHFVRRAPLVGPGSESPRSYRIGIDDKLQITIDGHPDLNRQSVVGPNGTVGAPLVGDIRAAGLTVDELAANLTEALAKDYLVDPLVTVEVTEYNSQWVLVTGSVRTPGRVAMKGPTHLKDVVARAGGLLPEAGNTITVTRRDSAGKDDVVERIPTESFERGEIDPPLAANDVVNVEKMEYCYVQGEVHNSVRVAVEPGLTLLRAITLAGGFTEWANTKRIQVLGEDPKARSAVYNVRDIEKHKIVDPPLQAGDVVIVKRRAL